MWIGIYIYQWHCLVNQNYFLLDVDTYICIVTELQPENIVHDGASYNMYSNYIN